MALEDTNYDLYTGRAYYDELVQRFDAANTSTRILLMSMSFSPDEAIVADLMKSLERALDHGADITFDIDAYSFMVHGRRLGPLWYRGSLYPDMPQIYRDKQAWLQKFSHPPNSNSTLLNIPSRRFSLHIAGRSHIKAALVDDYIIIGSNNLGDTQFINLAIGLHSKPAADWLYGLMLSASDTCSIYGALGGKDQSYQIDDKTSILIDAGRRNQSLIYDNALQLIDSAKEWLTITCQFFPSGLTAKHLLQALKRGVKVKILYGHPSHQGVVGGILQRASNMYEHTRLPSSMFEGKQDKEAEMIHAKLIACDAGVMIGSHNYVQAGVRLGTAEIALRSTNTSLASRAARTIEKQIDNLS